MTSRTMRLAATAKTPMYFARSWGFPNHFERTSDPLETGRAALHLARILALWRQLVALPKCEHATAEGQHGSPAYHALTAAIRAESDRFKQDTGDA